MTQRNIKKPDGGAICSGCQHDLIVIPERHDGCVYCSNESCSYHDKPHPTKFALNSGKK